MLLPSLGSLTHTYLWRGYEENGIYLWSDMMSHNDDPRSVDPSGVRFATYNMLRELGKAHTSEPVEGTDYHTADAIKTAGNLASAMASYHKGGFEASEDVSETFQKSDSASTGGPLRRTHEKNATIAPSTDPAALQASLANMAGFQQPNVSYMQPRSYTGAPPAGGGFPQGATGVFGHNIAKGKIGLGPGTGAFDSMGSPGGQSMKEVIAADAPLGPSMASPAAKGPKPYDITGNGPLPGMSPKPEPWGDNNPPIPFRPLPKIGQRPFPANAPPRVDPVAAPAQAPKGDLVPGTPEWQADLERMLEQTRVDSEEWSGRRFDQHDRARLDKQWEQDKYDAMSDEQRQAVDLKKEQERRRLERVQQEKENREWHQRQNKRKRPVAQAGSAFMPKTAGAPVKAQGPSPDLKLPGSWRQPDVWDRSWGAMHPESGYMKKLKRTDPNMWERNMQYKGFAPPNNYPMPDPTSDPLFEPRFLTEAGGAEPKVAGDRTKDPSYSPEHPEECCDSCGARQEQGADNKCNRCGGVFYKDASCSAEQNSWPGIKQAAGLDGLVQPLYNALGLHTGPGGYFGPKKGRQDVGDGRSALVRRATPGGFVDDVGTGYSDIQAANNALYGRPDSKGFAHDGQPGVPDIAVYGQALGSEYGKDEGHKLVPLGSPLGGKWRPIFEGKPKPKPKPQAPPVNFQDAAPHGLKQAWTVGDETGEYSNNPMQFAQYHTLPPDMSDMEPLKMPEGEGENAEDFIEDPYNDEYWREEDRRTLTNAMKSHPEAALHWKTEGSEHVGDRGWYNPMRYIDGKEKYQVREQQHDLLQGYTPEKLEEILDLIGSAGGEADVLSYSPNADEEWLRKAHPDWFEEEDPWADFAPEEKQSADTWPGLKQAGWFTKDQDEKKKRKGIAGLGGRKTPLADTRTPGILPWLAAGLGLGATGAAHGMGSDKQWEAAVKGMNDMAASTPATLPINTTSLQHYANNMSPAASLTPWGIPISTFVPTARRQSWLMGNKPLAPAVDPEVTEAEALAPHMKADPTEAPLGVNYAGEPIVPGENEDSTLSHLLAGRPSSAVAHNLDEDNPLVGFLREGVGQADAAIDNPLAARAAAAHYEAFAKGPIPGYAHMLRGYEGGYALDPKLTGTKPGETPPTHKEYFGPKFEEFIKNKTMATNGSFLLSDEINQDYMPPEEQTKLLQEWTASLSPAERIELDRVESPANSPLGGGNYQFAVDGGNMLRDKLKDVGVTAGGAGLGGLAGHGLYKYLTDDDEESWMGNTAATGAGLGLGGLAGYFGGTEHGRATVQRLVEALSKRMGKQSSDTWQGIDKQAFGYAGYTPEAAQPKPRKRGPRPGTPGEDWKMIKDWWGGKQDAKPGYLARYNAPTMPLANRDPSAWNGHLFWPTGPPTGTGLKKTDSQYVLPGRPQGAVGFGYTKEQARNNALYGTPDSPGFGDFAGQRHPNIYDSSEGMTGMSDEPGRLSAPRVNKAFRTPGTIQYGHHDNIHGWSQEDIDNLDKGWANRFAGIPTSPKVGWSTRKLEKNPVPFRPVQYMEHPTEAKDPDRKDHYVGKQWMTDRFHGHDKPGHDPNTTNIQHVPWGKPPGQVTPKPLGTPSGQSPRYGAQTKESSDTWQGIGGQFSE